MCIYERTCLAVLGAKKFVLEDMKTYGMGLERFIVPEK